MTKLRFLFRPVAVADERAFQRDNISRKTERYLQTNPLVRFDQDAGYRLKVDRIGRALKRADGDKLEGWILDLAGNTAGEATILQQQGLNFLVGDINEVALALSRERVRKFGLRSPAYVALDAHELPFAGASFSAVTVIEALHHFPDYARALAEIFRVLKPGGIFYSHEPNGLNPLRRLSEVRDRLRGSVEKSFFVSQVKRLCRQAGFEDIQVRAVAATRSTWKRQEVPAYRRPIHSLHGLLQEKMPRLFGPLEIQARKPGRLDETPVGGVGWEQLLRSPLGQCRLKFDEPGQRWVEVGGTRSFPDLGGIPILVRGDSRDAEWRGSTDSGAGAMASSPGDIRS